MCSPLNSASKKTKSKKKSQATVKTTEETAAVEQNELNTQDAESIKLPSVKNQRTYFYKIDTVIMNDVENGSPDALRSAMSALRQARGSELEETEKVLVFVSSEIMKLVWPSEKITWDIPSVMEDTPYTGALNSVRQGVFDSSTGNVDFLTTLLPALVILNNTADVSVYENCEKAVKAALEIKNDSVLANYIMGCIYEKMHDYENSEKYLEIAYNASSKVDEIGLAYARVLRNNGKLQVASSILGGINSGTNDIAILKQNAFIAFDSKVYDAADLYVARVLQQNPNDLEFL